MSSKESESLILDIDRFNLDVECAEQPALYMKWARRLEERRSELDALKVEIDITKAEVDADIREDPEKYGIDRVTEGAISAAILQSESVQNSIQDFNKMKETVGILQAAVNALDQRRRMLEALVFLHGQQYFSVPRHKETKKEIAQDHRKRKVRSKGRDPDV